MSFIRFPYVLVGLHCICLSTPAATILSEQQIWTDSLRTASISVTTTVLDNYNGDFALNEWRYTIENLTFVGDYYPECQIRSCSDIRFFDMHTVFPSHIAPEYYGLDSNGWSAGNYDWFYDQYIKWPYEHMWAGPEPGLPMGASVTLSLIGPPAAILRAPARVGVSQEPLGSASLSMLFRGTVPVPGTEGAPEPSAALLIASGGILLILLMRRYRRRAAL